MSGPKQMTIAILAERMDSTNKRLDKLENSMDNLTEAVNHRNEANAERSENNAVRLTRLEEFDKWVLRVASVSMAVAVLAIAVINLVK